MGEILETTQSLCPICLARIEAYKVKEDGKIYMVKRCNEHGEFKTILWRGHPNYEDWKRPKTPAYPLNPFTEVSKGCPYDCGLCYDHRQHTCTALIEITDRCNLKCEFCFANSGGNNDPDLDTIKYYYKRILESGGVCNIQLSGGEPTLRDDLPEIIKIGHDMGFEFIQLNTNGLRLKDLGFVKELKNAGLNSVFLQFDGLENSIYSALRGEKILEDKLKAIENLKKMDIGTVLVCTIVPGVNDSSLYDILKFGTKHIPTIRGVHFQPVSYFGRIPNIPKDKDRITLPEVMEKLCKQSENLIKITDFKPPGCENALCSFHANYIVMEEKLIHLGGNSEECICNIEKGEEGSRKAKDFVKRNWSLEEEKSEEGKYSSFTQLLNIIKNNHFSISTMAFQDVWNLDIERLMDCCIHVVSKEGNLIPFCAYNLTNQDGESLYRGN